MRKIIYFTFLIGLIWSWREGTLPSFGGSQVNAFDSFGNPIIEVYTAPQCGSYCDDVVKALNKRKTSFSLRVINPQNSDSEFYDVWKKHSGGALPLILSGNDKVTNTSTSQLVSLLGKNFGTKYLTHYEKRYFKKHFYADGSPKIVMYGADWCPYCKKLREEFVAAEQDFLEIDVDKSHEKDLITHTLQIGGYPTTWVGYTRVNGGVLSAVEKVLNSY